MASKRDQMKTGKIAKNELDTIFKERLGMEQEVVIERAYRVKTDENKKSNTPKIITCKI